MSGNEIKIPDVEQVFSRPDQQHRFASLCNVVILAETARPLPTFPTLDDAPGPDGAFDGAWTLPVDDPNSAKAAPFALPGWNAFQYKTRSVASSVTKAFAELKRSVRGAVKALIDKSGRPGQLRSYVLFTNLRLGPPVEAKADNGTRWLGRRRAELIEALREGLPPTENVAVSVIDAAHLQTALNRNPPLRQTFFGPRIFQTWHDSWKVLDSQKHGPALQALVGREAELTQLIQLRTDPSVKFIAVSGASGMGKTRLALDATRAESTEVYFVLIKSKFLEGDLAAYVSEHRRVFVVEDLRFEEAQELAKQVLVCDNICVIATIPAEEHLPEIKLNGSPAIRLVSVKPLDGLNARKLLDAVSPRLDHRAAEWLIQEAGGNPQVILAAAERGAKLRLEAGEFKVQVAAMFLSRAKDLFNEGVEDVLEVLSVLSPFDRTNEAHLAQANRFFGTNVTAMELRRSHTRLVGAGYVEASGRQDRDLNVSPPLLAAFLVERLLRDHPNRGRALFDGLDEDGRNRLLERMISIDSAESLSLWDHLLGTTGPFAADGALEQKVEMLAMLARAAPRQTARFIAEKATEVAALVNRRKHNLSKNWTKILTEEPEHYRENQRLDQFRGRMRSIMRELAFHTDSCRDALKTLEILVLAAPADTDSEDSFAKLFTECFVYWFTDFPLTLAERWPIVQRLLGSGKVAERSLGQRILFTITNPPHHLSGWAVERRRLMDAPVAVLWRDIHAYLGPALVLHVQLASAKGKAAEPAVARLAQALAQGVTTLPPSVIMPLMRTVVDGFFGKRLPIAAVELLSRVFQLLKQFAELAEKKIPEEWAAQLPGFVAELETIKDRFLNGPLPLRVELWVDRYPSYGLEKDPDTGERRYQTEIAQLAREIAATPQVLTPALRQIVIGQQNGHNFELARALGEADKNKGLWRRMQTLMGTANGDWIFSWYCLGVSRHDPGFVNTFLELHMAPARRSLSILQIIKIVGPSDENRRRMQELIRSGTFPPIQIARLFNGGRWLDDLPHREVLAVVKYTARDSSEECTETILQMVALYMHNKEHLPRVLVPVLQTILRRRGAHGVMTAHYRDDVATMVAKASLPAGMRLFRQLLAPHIRAKAYMESPGWNPLDNSNSSKDFYTHLRTQAPASTYREALRYLGSKWRMLRFHRETALFDLEAHGPLLLRIVKRDPKMAEALAGHIMPRQPGFWPVAYALVSNARTETIGDKLVSQCLTQDGMGGFSSHYQGAIDLFAEQLAQPASALSDSARSWLTVAKADVEQRLAKAREQFQQAADHDRESSATASG